MPAHGPFPRLIVSVAEFAKSIGIDRATAYRLAKDPDDPLPIRKLSKGTAFLFIDEAEAYLRSRPLGVNTERTARATEVHKRNLKQRAGGGA
jgi:hypothetical protein